MKLTKYIWTRKTIHLSASLLPILYYHFFSRYQFFIITLILTLIALLTEFLRFKNERFACLFYKVFGKLLWAHESHTLAASTTFIIGALIATALFSKTITVTVLLFLTFGDTIAYFVGNTIGRIKLFGEKTLEGAIACFLMSLIIALMIPGIKLWQGVLGALVASVVELLPWRIDDNFSIPIISGAFLQLFTHI
ncbi:hypothetical protein KAW50_03815 [candidate division WOR-3 bacterium]|nr:hypothetical protein [candidate division WOR-3 bacterium]